MCVYVKAVIISNYGTMINQQISIDYQYIYNNIISKTINKYQYFIMLNVRYFTATFSIFRRLFIRAREGRQSPKPSHTLYKPNKHVKTWKPKDLLLNCVLFSSFHSLRSELKQSLKLYCRVGTKASNWLQCFNCESAAIVEKKHWSLYELAPVWQFTAVCKK